MVWYQRQRLYRHIDPRSARGHLRTDEHGRARLGPSGKLNADAGSHPIHPT
jgi:hypothetical protein